MKWNELGDEHLGKKVKVEFLDGRGMRTVRFGEVRCWNAYIILLVSNRLRVFIEPEAEVELLQSTTPDQV